MVDRSRDSEEPEESEEESGHQGGTPSASGAGGNIFIRGGDNYAVTQVGTTFTWTNPAPSIFTSWNPIPTQGTDMPSLYLPSMTYFQEWIDRLTGDEEVRFNYQSGRRAPPFFAHGSYRDYEVVIEIAGRTIMAYTDGPPSLPEGGVAIQFDHNENYNENGGFEVVGWEQGEGIHLAIDPRYLRFVSYNEETSRWDHVEVEEGEPNACQVLLEAINADTFFREWRPPTLEDVMRRTWLTKREQQIAMATRRVSGALSNIDTYERTIEASRQELIEARAALSEWGHMTLEKFMESINQYRDQLEGIGNSLEVSDGSITMVLDRFQVQGVDLGPYKIEFTLGSSRIRVHNHGNCVRSRNGHYHPHVGADGHVCWGQHESVYQASLGNPFEALFLTAGFLKTGYYPSGAYCRLESWAVVNTYFCEHCNARHNNGSACPAECGECNQQVNWDVHAHCPRHFLCHDTDGDDCSACEAEKDAAETKRLEAAEAAKERAKKKTTKKTKKKAKKKTTKKKAIKKKRKKVSKRQSRRSIPVHEAAE